MEKSIGKEKRLFPSPKRLDRLWGTRNIPFKKKFELVNISPPKAKMNLYYYAYIKFQFVLCVNSDVFTFRAIL
jgi:hypothetical protein